MPQTRWLHLLLVTLLAAGPLAAQPVPSPAAVSVPAPKLIVVLSVDQFSADLFAEYRNRFTGGFKRLLDGAVFPSAYQGHAATETCPGHSTILTGSLPARTGIIANRWFDQRIARADKRVYCAEDPTIANEADASGYTASAQYLLMPTLGERRAAEGGEPGQPHGQHLGQGPRRADDGGQDGARGLLADADRLHPRCPASPCRRRWRPPTPRSAPGWRPPSPRWRCRPRARRDPAPCRPGP